MYAILGVITNEGASRTGALVATVDEDEDDDVDMPRDVGGTPNPPVREIFKSAPHAVTALAASLTHEASKTPRP